MKKLTIFSVLFLFSLSSCNQKEKTVTQEKKTVTQEKGKFTDARDGKSYNTVKIGNQTWMAENLAYKTSKGCWAYDNDPNNVKIYGYLYDWQTALNVCPTGWHLPSDKEWTELTDYLGENAGGKLKGKSLWYDPNTGATNETGFTALPSGNRYNTGYFDFSGHSGYWWSATEDGTDYVWGWGMYYMHSILCRRSSGKELGFSVRCVKD
ncbi:MAG: fibrobacter succinogenes major paralogous domain-containing protein [Bacteroidales bacterium]|jgi:uncharacterized protein (TIGR02145 family)|nr:fibrobacter succinogenes major paralogous domain-containing protein [Bacteroidales bacterium]